MSHVDSARTTATRRHRRAAMRGAGMGALLVLQNGHAATDGEALRPETSTIAGRQSLAGRGDAVIRPDRSDTGGVPGSTSMIVSRPSWARMLGNSGTGTPVSTVISRAPVRVKVASAAGTACAPAMLARGRFIHAPLAAPARGGFGGRVPRAVIYAFYTNIA
ncbi:MAG: hypothetical protein AAF982_07980 [Pseudomonadota bacterium]